VPAHNRMRGFDRDLIHRGHYGQRSSEPHLQAEHMAAPTKPATRRFLLPTRSRPHMARLRHPAMSVLWSLPRTDSTQQVPSNIPDVQRCASETGWTSSEAK
jgi:hypothetical protein